MKLIACGLNHKTAELAVREQLAAPQALPELLTHFQQSFSGSEVVILYTCNRTELYSVNLAESDILRWFAEVHPVSLQQLQTSCYQHHEQAALRHMMQVACGLDSMVLGEAQILGQLKQAYKVAQEVGTVGPALTRVFQQVFTASKKVRHHTGLGEHPVSIAYASISLAKQIFSDLAPQRALLIGAGDTIELSARYLQQHGVTQFHFANRTAERAQYLAEQFGGQAWTLSEIPQVLNQVDIIVTATASPLPLLGKGLLERVVKTRKHRPMLLLDLAVPRDIEPEVGQLQDVFLYNIDDLQTVINQNLGKRAAASVQAEQVIESELENYVKWQRSLRAVKAIRAYRGQMAAVTTQELHLAELALKRGDDPVQVLQAFSHRLSHKLLHQPTKQLRKAGYDGRDDLLELAEQLFEGE
jgi:glutamyl-tRNA reductase